MGVVRRASQSRPKPSAAARRRRRRGRRRRPRRGVLPSGHRPGLGHLVAPSLVLVPQRPEFGQGRRPPHRPRRRPAGRALLRDGNAGGTTHAEAALPRLAGVRGIRAPLYAVRNGCPNSGIWGADGRGDGPGRPPTTVATDIARAGIPNSPSRRGSWAESCGTVLRARRSPARFGDLRGNAPQSVSARHASTDIPPWMVECALASLGSSSPLPRTARQRQARTARPIFSSRPAGQRGELPHQPAPPVPATGRIPEGRDGDPAGARSPPACSNDSPTGDRRP